MTRRGAVHHNTRAPAAHRLSMNHPTPTVQAVTVVASLRSDLHCSRRPVVRLAPGGLPPLKAGLGVRGRGRGERDPHLDGELGRRAADEQRVPGPLHHGSGGPDRLPHLQPGTAQSQPVTVAVTASHSHSTVTASHSHSTVTAQSQHSHSHSHSGPDRIPHLKPMIEGRNGVDAFTPRSWPTAPTSLSGGVLSNHRIVSTKLSQMALRGSTAGPRVGWPAVKTS